MIATVDLVEIFSSIQGEGLFVGCRQLFIRFAGCNLSCGYCDTPASQNRSVSARLEQQAGKRDFMEISNPITINIAADVINNLLSIPHHSVSLTGGEPLCQADAILQLAPLIRGKVYLETNGTLYHELERVLPYIDIISMDIKMPSASTKNLWYEHEHFLKLAVSKKTFVKIVVASETTLEEFDQAISLIAKTDGSIPTILQPVSPNELCHALTPDVVLMLQERALKKLQDVRVIPQTHKYLGQM